MTTAAVVGSGPNGLAAATVLAAAGVDVTVHEAAPTPGGAARSAELMVPGVVHDLGSAVHPLAVLSPALAGLDRFGLRFAWPEVDLAHPVHGGPAGVLLRDIAATADRLDDLHPGDGRRWRAAFGPVADRMDRIVSDVLAPPGSPGVSPAGCPPSGPLAPAAWASTLRFGLRAALPAASLAHLWRSPQARALVAGVAAHAFTRLDRPLSAAPGVLLTGAGHAAGWPVAVGGSGAVTAAMVRRLESLGGRVVTGSPVRDLRGLDADLVLLDTSPAAASALLRRSGTPVPTGRDRAYRRFRHGPGVLKVDCVVRGEVPWSDAACRRAGTVHLGGTAREVAAAERDCVRGRMPDAPFVLVGQQHLADPGRSAGDLHPLWAYAHVPHGWEPPAGADPWEVAGPVIRRIGEFAPGFRDVVVDLRVRTPRDLERENPNLTGGDIAGGASDAVQLLRRPTVLDPYSTGVPGVFLCSASTPPGGGVHGLCGWFAAHRALRGL
ncbi:NAD(P)/FAD-dependent oxidoreductase [Corynebacterium bovis]|uniref:phytoene desaturase family protein n=1 Tax=Corynebacterium bovis TaxID=36808 RepID=UPI0031390126